MNQTMIRCPKCETTDVAKSGFTRKDDKTVPRYVCRKFNCQKEFTEDDL